MTLDNDTIAGLNVALNESTLVAVDFDLVRQRASVTLQLLSLAPAQVSMTKREVELSLSPVGRLIVSLSEGGAAQQVKIQTVSALVESFRGRPIYGWEFIDPPNLNVSALQNPLSLDYQTGNAGITHVIHLFQQSKKRQLDILMWFNDLSFGGIDGREIPVEEVIMAGKCYWDAVFAGDPRAGGAGIEPLN
jgi:hypothetical protein